LRHCPDETRPPDVTGPQKENDVEHGIRTIIYPTRDIAKAKAVLTALAGSPIQDQPYYVGFELEGQQIGLDPNGHAQGMTGPVAYWHVDNIDTSLAALLAAGAAAQRPITDVVGGRRIATVQDADGNVIGLLQP
jgi:predicted enzyme related to lactoylglutathione lyase